MMAPSRLRIARDYNRALPAPVRWAHLAWATVATALDGVRCGLGWLTHPARPWALPAVLLLAAFLATNIDGPVSRFLETRRPSGDLRRELEALQQFGQFAVSILVAWAVFLLDRPRARRLLDWLLAVLVALPTVILIKGLTGRPRPHLSDPAFLTGPFGLYPVPHADGYRMMSGWTSGYDLASFPSRHACFAVIAAVFLCTFAPRVKPLAVTLALIVCTARVALGAHYLSDVLAGAALGLLIAQPICRNAWGVRGLDLVWKRWISPSATPAWPRLAALETARGPHHPTPASPAFPTTPRTP